MLNNNTSKSEVNVVWFKRDLRLLDNEALFAAHNSGLSF